MTALRVRPSEFGYPPAREARALSEQAFERAVTLSCALMGAVFVLAFALRGLVPGPLEASSPPTRSYALEDFRQRVWTPEVPVTTAVRPRPSAGPPLPVPDAAVTSEPVVSAPAWPAGQGAVESRSGAGAGEANPDATGSGAVPEPGVWQYVEQQPEVAVRVAPEYPELAREAQVEGTVLLWALVGLDGRVDEVRVQRSVPLLDGAARAAVAKWRFTPALANGQPVRVWVAVPVRFSIR